MFLLALFDSQTYRSEKVSITIFQVDKVRNSSRAVSQERAHDLLESLRASGYEYSADVMTVVRSWS